MHSRSTDKIPLDARGIGSPCGALRRRANNGRGWRSRTREANPSASDVFFGVLDSACTNDVSVWPSRFRRLRTKISGRVLRAPRNIAEPLADLRRDREISRETVTKEKAKKPMVDAAWLAGRSPKTGRDNGSYVSQRLSTGETGDCFRGNCFWGDNAAVHREYARSIPRVRRETIFGAHFQRTMNRSRELARLIASERIEHARSFNQINQRTS